MKKKVLLVFTFILIIYSCNFTSNMKNGNNLIHETSPYLLQHAQNPVNWSPWKNKYLEKAISENKLIVVSIDMLHATGVMLWSEKVFKIH